MARYYAYFDTAGTQSALDETTLVTVGVVATESRWDRFDRRWLTRLRRDGLSDLHMNEFAHSTGQFKRWKGDHTRRAALLEDLMAEAKRCINKVFITAVLVSDYREVDARYLLSEDIGGPYSFAQTACIVRTARWLGQAKTPRDAFAFFVEQGDAGQGAFRRFLEREFSGLAVEIHPRVDAKGESITPFQLCDFIAYEHRTVYRRSLVSGPANQRLRRSFAAIRRHMPLEAGIFTANGIERFCEGVKVPLRAADGMRGG